MAELGFLREPCLGRSKQSDQSTQRLDMEHPDLKCQISDDVALGSFFQAIGSQVIFTSGHLWYEVGPRTFFPLPSHKPFVMTSDDLKSMWRKGAFLLRYPTEYGTSGYPSYTFQLTNKDYGLSDLKSKSRNQTRRGLENCVVRSVSFDSLLDEGMPLVVDTISRQNRRITKRASNYWQKFFSHAGACAALDAWGAFVGDALAAYLLSITHKECVHIHMVFSRSDMLRYYPVNALTFVFAQDAIQRGGITHVSYGIRSIRGDMESLNRFKEGMGFQKTPIGERIEVNTWLRIWFDWGLAQGVRYISSKYCGQSELAANLHGLASTFLEQDLSQ